MGHTGWADLANHVLRLHLPIISSHYNECGVWVDGCVEYQTQKRIILFDDSKCHRAFNYSLDCERIVLILDLVRPSNLPKGYATGAHTEELDLFIQQFLNY